MENRQYQVVFWARYLSGRLSYTFFITLLSLLPLLPISANASVYQSYQSSDQSELKAAPEDGLKTAIKAIVLTDPETKYSIASLNHSSGFIVAKDRGEKNPQLEQALSFSELELSEEDRFGLNPDFYRHSHYRLYSQITNQSDTEHWVLHVSTFGLKNTKVLIRDKSQQQLYLLDSHQPGSQAFTNTLGRAVKVELPRSKNLELIIEVNAAHPVWPPYIALMSEPEYQQWSTQLDYLYKLAIGIILGVVFICLICWTIMKDQVFLWSAASSVILMLYYLEHSRVPADLLGSNYEKGPMFWFLFSATFISILLFSSSFLQLNSLHKVWRKLYLGLGAMSLLSAALSLILPFKTISALYALTHITILLVVILAGVHKVRAHGRYYLMYILGWLPIVLSLLHVFFHFLVERKTLTQIDVSYKLLWAIYMHILHLFIHAVALIHRFQILKREKEKAEKLSQYKSEFIAQSSHDLYQPLHTMNLHIDSLRQYIDNDKAFRALKRLRLSHEILQQDLNAIMDLNKLEAGEITADMNATCVATLFETLKQEYQPLAEHKGLDLRIHSSTLAVETDPELLTRILRNLLSNAIKYTDHGRVVLGCRRKGQHLELQVIDTGVGMKPCEQAIAFDIYKRLDKRGSGKGIGLSIVKHLTEVLNCSLKMNSEPGRGTTFSLRIPVTHAAPTNRLKIEKSPNPFRIAVTINDPSIHLDIKKQLADMGYHLIHFYSLHEAIAELGHYDALICDERSLEDSQNHCFDWNHYAAKFALVCISSSQYTKTHDNGAQHNSEQYNSEQRPSPQHPITITHPWINLNYPITPLQFRALLNYLERLAA